MPVAHQKSQCLDHTSHYLVGSRRFVGRCWSAHEVMKIPGWPQNLPEDPGGRSRWFLDVPRFWVVFFVPLVTAWLRAYAGLKWASIDCGFMMICGYCWYIYIYIRINIYEYSWWFMMIYGYSCLGKTTTRRSRGWSKMDPRGAGPKSACRIMAPGRGRIRLRC